MSISLTSVTSLPFRTLPASLGRFLANTLDLRLVGLSPFALERSKSTYLILFRQQLTGNH